MFNKSMDNWRINQIKKWESRGQQERLVKLLKRPNLSDSVMIEGIRSLGRERFYIDDEASAILPGLLARADLSDALMIEAIKACGKNGHPNCIVDMFDRKDLSLSVRKQLEPSLLEAISVAGKLGCTEEVAGLLDRKNLSATVRAQIEPSLLKGLKVYGRPNEAIDLLGRKDLGDAVMIEAIKICEATPCSDCIASLLERKDLSDAVRNQANVSLKAITARLAERSEADAVSGRSGSDSSESQYPDNEIHEQHCSAAPY